MHSCARFEHMSCCVLFGNISSCVLLVGVQLVSSSGFSSCVYLTCWWKLENCRHVRLELVLDMPRFVIQPLCVYKDWTIVYASVDSEPTPIGCCHYRSDRGGFRFQARASAIHLSHTRKSIYLVHHWSLIIDHWSLMLDARSSITITRLRVRPTAKVLVEQSCMYTIAIAMFVAMSVASAQCQVPLGHWPLGHWPLAIAIGHVYGRVCSHCHVCCTHAHTHIRIGNMFSCRDFRARHVLFTLLFY